ncbi:MAG: TetR/AcrR family transcriptional regulator [Micavibrio aeruginosavorus]|uniref:TetR/AcrR family transcriptional regulator n=1 Tax=Micavibrio aeruginosavorus TaxID=349221 RepID=A0A2W5A8Z6_9BACT|nr:MAG: TetR/AcrR family transcriptional regulator [Micavibrio aeruginosavorus]
MPRASKRDKILETASKLFIENGFQGVSVDQIAAAVPVSKPTLYNHFIDKRDLFIAVIAVRCAKVLKVLKDGMEEHANLEDGLKAFGMQFTELLMSRQSLQLHRLIIGESDSFPDMAKMFYETGPEQMHILLTAFLETAPKKPGICIHNPAFAAEMFISMLKGRTHLRHILGIEKKQMSEKDRQAFVNHVVNLFLHGHHLHKKQDA